MPDVQTDRVKLVNVKWDNDKSDTFIRHLNLEEQVIDTLEAQIDGIIDNDTNTTSTEIDSLVDSIGEVFISAARQTDMIKVKHKHKNSSNKKTNKPWFNEDCKQKRKIFQKCKRNNNTVEIS